MSKADKLKCGCCGEVSCCTEWQAEYSEVLEWPVLKCPRCGDGTAILNILEVHD